MSDDWQVGDLAMIVRGGGIKCPNPHPAFGYHTGEDCPPVGSVRWVVSALSPVFPNGLRCGCITLKFDDGRAALTERCRKIRPHTPDAEDAETIALLTGKPATVPA